jgi:segregation and condensation protein B
MSDDTLPPDEIGPNEESTKAPTKLVSLQFFDDGLEPPTSLHAAATQTSPDAGSSSFDAPIAFPLPIELGLFHGVPAQAAPTSDAPDDDDDDDDDDQAPRDAENVVCIFPRASSPGAIWDLRPAGEEATRDPYDANAPLKPPAPSQLQGTIEALLFAADGPLTVPQLNIHLGEPGKAAIRPALYSIQATYRRPGSGIRLVEVAKGWQLRTDIYAARYVASLRGEQPFKLSRAALETLSIVSYRQPVTRSEVEDLRGVDPGGILRMLSERGLIAVTGRKDEPGRPLLYGTTPEFLSLFGLRDLSDLPSLRDLRELQQDDARDGIGSTDGDPYSAITGVLSQKPAIDTPHFLHPVQEALPLHPYEPID